MNLHLLIPALFWPEASLPEIYLDLPLPALENLLARSLCTNDGSQAIEAWLCRAFSVPQQRDWPVAPITLQSDGIENLKTEDDYWLRADPVHLRIERDELILADSRIFKISPDEAGQFAGLLNRHFTGNNQEMVFFPLRPDRWYLRITEIPPPETHLLSEAVNKKINGLLPFGMNSMFWRSLFNEIQMLLHEHPLNQSREDRGELAINSTWFWGGGSTPKSVVCPYNYVWSNDILASSLALASGTDPIPLPRNAGAWCQSAVSGNHLVVLNALHGKAQYGDAYGWRESLKELEQNWFEPLWRMVKSGKLNQLTLTALNANKTKNFTLRRSDLRKFWLRAKPFSIYAG